MKTRAFLKRTVFLAAITLLLSCASKQEYKMAEQTPAPYISGGSSAIVAHERSACPDLPAAFEGSAFEYLQAIVSTGDRRTGTLECRCSQFLVGDAFARLGYEVEELDYTFPYYQFDPGDFGVTRVSDGREFAAYPMHYSAPLNGARRGVVKLPVGDLDGCFVFVPGFPSLPGDFKKRSQKWRDQGALGVIREADLRPLAAKGLLHSARAHPTSWYYSPLPGLVVADARELLGEEIEVRGKAEIVRGQGVNIVARGPVSPGGYVLVTAHIDSWFEGALDDASGVAVMLAAARLLKDDPEGLIFLAADSEEIGLIGSAAYVQHYGVDEVAAVIELDMVSSLNNYTRRSPEGGPLMPRLISVSKGMGPWVRPHFKELSGRNLVVPINLTIALTGGLPTDMEWFYRAGTPGVFVYAPSYYYHTPRDTIEWIPEDDINQMAHVIAALARELRANAGRVPAVSGFQDFDFEVEPSAGDTVSFELRLRDGGASSLPGLVKAAVNCYFENGFEDKVELEREPDGAWRGTWRPPRPGEWQFLAVVSKGRNSGKKWRSLTLPPDQPG